MSELVRIPQALHDWDTSRAVELVRQYFDTSLPGRHFSGAFFERLDGGGDREAVRNRFTGADLVAVTLLSVRVPRVLADHLRERREEFGELLEQMPHDLDLVDAHPRYIDETSAASELLSRLKEVDGADWAVTNTLLARKRPRLFPVYDNSVRDPSQSPTSFWSGLQESLAARDNALHRRLLHIRHGAGVGDDISAVRVFDVVCWMLAQLQ